MHKIAYVLSIPIIIFHLDCMTSQYAFKINIHKGHMQFPFSLAFYQFLVLEQKSILSLFGVFQERKSKL